MKNWNPETDYADLKREYLIMLGALFRRARDEAAGDHRPEKGESAFALGVSAWERTKFELIRASQMFKWLTIVSGATNGASHFIFRVGTYPIRFYHGAPEEILTRYLLISPEEQQALKIPGQLPNGHILRVSIETGQHNKTTGVALSEYDGAGEIVHSFQIPLTFTATQGATSSSSTVTPFVSEKQGVELGPPAVEVKRDRKQQRRE